MLKEREDAEGHQRMMCPAEASKVQPAQAPLVDPEPSHTGSVKVCRQRAITLAPDEGAKHWQALGT